MAQRGQLFELPAAVPVELIETLTARSGVRVERIVSRGHASPPDFWYDQEEDEWVIVLRGRAAITVEGEPTLELGPGDWIDLPAHRRHRVEWTEQDTDTVWLAFFWPAGVADIMLPR